MKNPYLKPNRLADVLALIQVLALDTHAHRSEKGLAKELQGKPKSGSNDTWVDIANDHPEFFRVDKDELHGVSLVSRHVLPRVNGVRTLPVEFVHKLMDTAIQLHDKQVKRSERWRYWIPVYAVMITGFISILLAFYKM
ncbi:MAG: hypothetical protein H6602_06005 [Flavobacteriales bacterium]|nr:hypothetical protein [Flavobacteriales bacterium]